MNTKQLDGIMKAAASRTWDGVTPDTKVVESDTKEQSFAVLKLSGGRGEEAVEMRWIEIRLVGDEAMPIRMGYSRLDDTLLIEELESNREVMSFLVDNPAK